MHDMTISGARGVLTWHYTLPVEGETFGKVFPGLGIFGQTNRSRKVACLLC